MSSGKNSAVNFQGSPESAGPTEGDLISVQYYALPSASEPNEPDSESPKYVYYPYLAIKLYFYVYCTLSFVWFIIFSSIRTIVVW